MTTPPTTKHILLFIDTCFSKPGGWRIMESLLEHDNELKDVFAVQTFSFQPQTHLDGIAKKLAEKISRDCQNCELTLVVHGLEVAVLFKYLTNLSSPGYGSPGTFIQQIILFAPFIAQSVNAAHAPSLMEKLSSMIAFRFSTLNAIVKKYEELAPEIRKISDYVETNVFNGRTVAGRSETYPLFVLCGTEDELIDTRRITRYFRLATLVRTPGKHLSIIRPVDENAESWKEFRGSLREPYGHRHTLLVKSLAISIKVSPGSHTERMVKKGRTENTLFEDHVGTVIYRVDFSRRNVCRSRFPITFYVQENGYIHELSKSYERTDRVLPAIRGAFERLHTTYRSEFDHQPNQNSYQLSLEIINGFSDAQFPVENNSPAVVRQDSNFYVPFFLGLGERYYEHITVAIDLRPFTTKGKSVDDLRLLWLPYEVDYNLNYRQLMNKFSSNQSNVLYTTKEVEAGHWEMTLDNFRYGTLIVTWSLSDK